MCSLHTFTDLKVKASIFFLAICETFLELFKCQHSAKFYAFKKHFKTFKSILEHMKCKTNMFLCKCCNAHEIFIAGTRLEEVALAKPDEMEISIFLFQQL